MIFILNNTHIMKMQPRSHSAQGTSQQRNQAPRHQYQQYTSQRPRAVDNNQAAGTATATSQIPNPPKAKEAPPQGKEGWTVVLPAPLSPSLPPCQRSLHAAAVVKDSLYVFGGYDGTSRVNDFFQYHFPTGGWREIITVGGNGILVGGTYQVPVQGGNADMGGGNDNANLGGGGDRPRVAVPPRAAALGGSVTATGSVPTPRDRHAAVVHNSTFYIFGGFDGTSRVNDLYGFDVDRLEWRQVRHLVPNVLANNAGVAGQVAGGRRVGFNVDAGGGVGNENNNADAWQNLGQQDRRENGIEVDFHHNEQQQPPQQQAGGVQHHPPPSPRHSHSAVVHNDSMFVFGGYDGSYRSDFHEFDFIHSSWRPVFASGRTPRARYRATACVHEDMMVLFGGHDGTRHLSGTHGIVDLF